MDLFSPDFKPTPYWWEASPLEPEEDTDCPAQADVVVIGAGYTGLQAAIQSARAGLDTVVLDAENAGFGCSSRNGGQISTSVKLSYGELALRFGADLGGRILGEGLASREYIRDFVKAEGIDCDFATVGRFHGMHKPALYEKTAREIAQPNPIFASGAYMVPRGEQHGEIGTDAYYGGVVHPHHASIDPGKYHRGLLQVARKAGAQVISHSPVLRLARRGDGFEVTSARGVIRAGQVILATNGYSGPLSPWHRRRVIPIGSYMMASAPIDRALMDQLIPKNRILSDSRKLVYYYRASPDRRRILFGGRVSLSETDPRKSGPRLWREMVRIFPQLNETPISHSWAGTVGYSFDKLMHTGCDNGLYYAMGYCGSGVGMASYLGMRIGQQAAGLAEGASAFDEVPFPTMPLYRGNPWFLAPSVLVYRLRDRLGL